ncbi:MAG: TIGR01906 family membrane protein [Chloroflexota bacterium]
MSGRSVGSTAVDEPLPALLVLVPRIATAIAVPVLLLTVGILAVASDRGFIERGFQRYQVSRVTGISPEQLSSVAQAFVDYFNAPAGRMDIQVQVNGRRRALFNAKEIRHMVDVQSLMHLAQRARTVSAVALVVAVAAILVAAGRVEGLAFAARQLALAGLLGGGITLGLLALLGLMSLVDFSAAFVKFHQLSFGNDDWMLDPRTDYLIMLFPEGFWLDSALRVGAITGGGAAIITALSGAALLWANRWSGA